jgi:hypothetical protein
MTQYYLLNSIQFGSGFKYAGDLVDTAVDGSGIVAAIQSAGGALVPATDTTTATAAALCQQLRLRGTPLASLNAIMTGALGAAAFANATTAQAFIQIPLTSFRVVDANNLVGAIAAAGGVLASDSAPVLAATSKAQTITWATGSVPPISTQVAIPADFDNSGNASLDLVVSSGTTDAASISVQAIWDQAAAVTYAADDSAMKSATAHKVSVAFLAADMPAQPLLLGVMLTPPTHATNAIKLWGCRLNYKRKVLTS